MNTVSQSKFAKIIGCTPQFIPKIAARLTWVKVKGKKKEQIDLHGKHTLEYLGNREADQKQVQSLEELEDIPAQPPQTVASGLGNNPSGLPGTNPIAINLKDEKVRLQNEKIQLEIDQKRGDLIEKKLVISTHNALAGIDINQLKSLNVIIGPKIDSVYTRRYSGAVVKILKLIDKKEDHELKTDILKILNSNSEPNKKEITEITEDAIGKILRNIQREFDLFLQRADET